MKIGLAIDTIDEASLSLHTMEANGVKMKKMEISKFERYFLYILFFELFAGGGGHLLAVGPLSIRQILFAGLIIIFAIRFVVSPDTRREIWQYFRHPNTAVFWLSLLMTAWIFVSSFIGIIHGHGAGPVATDFFRVIYVILIIPFIYYVGEHRLSVNDLVRCLFVAAGVVAILTVFISLTGKFIDDATFHHFYEWINGLMPGDLFFRPSRGVFYKSDFLVMFAVIIGLIKLAEKKISLGEGIVLILGSLSIILSETRGLYLGILVGIGTYIAVKVVIYFWGDRYSLNLNRAMNIRRALVLLVTVALCGFFYTNATIARFSKPSPSDIRQEDRLKKQDRNISGDDISLSSRFVLLSDAMDIVKSESAVGVVVGNGYGTTIGNTKIGIEMSFVDILVEQGAMGLVLWLAFALLPLYYFFRSFLLSRQLADIYIGLLGSSLSMILVTNINPFLNSPIGLGFLLPVIVIAYKAFISAKTKNQPAIKIS
ncbi:MAG: O-antigen ligase family protein [Lacticaseibacillus paracasei]